ncbi:helix-turn-helix domain-containing protein [Kribbella jiaozuonensis]|uniref:Transcriptional regulator n=1 Tax=Kribbella jiaozuonensis TaxID=2575441 RepID=A0A4U3LP54_9ACTN|nr:helix-turn-helix domain-containing protein [Kribbella jiaozuonensis]TKK77440.1 transcriptional regulator [Kribbella jiaozuonensis]
MPEQHPLVDAITPLVERLNAQLVPPGDARADDIPLVWEGEPVVAVRLPAPVSSPAGAPAATGSTGVQGLLAEVADELGGPLDQLSRHDKQRAVLMLEARGAFEFRKSAEIVAEALGVTRFTVYNYLNRAR